MDDDEVIIMKKEDLIEAKKKKLKAKIKELEDELKHISDSTLTKYGQFNEEVKIEYRQDEGSKSYTPKDPKPPRWVVSVRKRTPFGSHTWCPIIERETTEQSVVALKFLARDLACLAEKFEKEQVDAGR